MPTLLFLAFMSALASSSCFKFPGDKPKAPDCSRTEILVQFCLNQLSQCQWNASEEKEDVHAALKRVENIVAKQKEFLAQMEVDSKKQQVQIKKLETQVASHNQSTPQVFGPQKKFMGPSVDCGDVLARDPAARSGVYTVYTGLKRVATRVFCDMDTWRGGWTSVLRRFDGSVRFNRKWEEVKHLIGDLEAEHWLGLEALYRITTEGPGRYELLVQLEDEVYSQFAHYASFRVEDDPHKYRLHVSGYSGRSTAGDSMAAHNGKSFSTSDNDNDRSAGNCAAGYEGAWWYYSCHQSSLLAAYLYTPKNRGYNSAQYYGINWYHFRGLHTAYYRSLKKASMKIRRVG